MLRQIRQLFLAIFILTILILLIVYGDVDVGKIPSVVQKGIVGAWTGAMSAVVVYIFYLLFAIIKRLILLTLNRLKDKIRSKHKYKTDNWN